MDWSGTFFLPPCQNDAEILVVDCDRSSRNLLVGLAMQTGVSQGREMAMSDIIKGYEEDGYCFPVDVLDGGEVDEVCEGVNGMPPKKKPQFIECLTKIETKKFIRKDKNGIHFTSSGMNAHSGSSSSCSGRFVVGMYHTHRI